jgi:hypothetical protein
MAGPPRKDYGKTTATPFNKSGIFAGGSTTSGTSKTPEKGPMGQRERMGYLAEAAKSKTFRGGVGGSGTSPKSGMYGSGKDRKYVDVPEPNKDSRKGAEAFKGGPTGSGSMTAADKKRDAGRGGSHSSGSGGSATAAPGSLNYFMQKTGADGKGNAKNRAYTLYKRAQQNKRRNGA